MVPAKLLIVVGILGLLLGAFAWGLGEPQKSTAKPNPPGSEELVVAGGCFWCLEVLYEDLKGVYFVESAYVGGKNPGVTYREVCEGNTGHAEAVKIVFDPKKISAEDLLRVFFATHNPTTLNQQGPDHGTQYRSAIFYSNEEERLRAVKIRDEIAKRKIWDAPLVTTIEPMKNYTRAEEYHQDYYAKYEKASAVEKMSMNAGYCNAIIAPKVAKFRKEYADRLRKD